MSRSTSTSSVAGKAEGSSLMRNLLGGKGCELAEMTNLGIPVPPGFTITTQAWARYNAAGRQCPTGCGTRSSSNLARLERHGRQSAGRRRAAAAGLRPLRRPRVDARHDGDRPQPRPQRRRRSRGWRRWTANERFAWDCYRRFITMFGNVVLGIKRERLRRAARRGQDAARRARPTPRCRPPSSASWSRSLQELVQRADGRARSRRTRTSSSAWPSTPSSTRGSPRRPWSTGASTASPPTGARRSP